MKDIHEVLRRKQAKYAQLAKQIEALQQAAENLFQSGHALPLLKAELKPVSVRVDDTQVARWLTQDGRPVPGR